MTSVKRKTTSSSSKSSAKKKAKPAAKLVAKKTPAVKSEKTRSRLTLKSDGNRIITLVTSVNPKRPSSDAFKVFALYQDGMTVRDFINAGGTFPDLNFDSKKGFIELSKSEEQEQETQAE